MSGTYGSNSALRRLYEKTSNRGTQYFTGSLGWAKLVLLKCNEVAENGDPIWLLSVQETTALPPAKSSPSERAADLFWAPKRTRTAEANWDLASEAVDDLFIGDVVP
jgi:hypothetical protein